MGLDAEGKVVRDCFVNGVKEVSCSQADEGLKRSYLLMTEGK